jgi:hypothetical protein
MCRLIKLLEARGHKRIGAVFETGFEERIQFHFTAAIKLLDHGDNIYRIKDPTRISRPELAQWLKEKRLDAVVCPFALALQEAAPPSSPGFRAPEIIGLRAIKGSALSYWDECPEEIGSDAALLLAGMVQHNETGVPESPRTSMVHGVFHDASSQPPTEPDAKKSAKTAAPKNPRRRLARA